MFRADGVGETGECPTVCILILCMCQQAVNKAGQSTNYCAYVLVNFSKLQITVCLDIKQNNIYHAQNFEPWLLTHTFL